LRFAPFRTAPDIDSTGPDTTPVRDWEAGLATVFAAIGDHFWFGPAARVAADTSADLGNAARVERLGAGVVPPASSTPAGIAAAVRSALADPGLAAGARRQAAVIRAGLAADRAVAELEAQARTGAHPRNRADRGHQAAGAANAAVSRRAAGWPCR
jgi:hypothetical protein